jgi:4-hydroxy-tetrahydrodipicolinate synthase
MAELWKGVFPAVTTPFHPDGTLDLPGFERHLATLIGAGVHGLVLLGSLGENGTLSADEKLELIRCAVRTAGNRVPVLAGVAETTTARACEFVRQGQQAGLDGFMVLPPMQYVADRRETIHHLRAVAGVAERPLMIYNNPVAYRVDITPEMFEVLADESRFVALKESSDDVRRVTEIQRRLGDRYAIFVGVDDLAMESLLMGARGWVAGLVCAFPRESVVLYSLITAGRLREALVLYRWFVPLLHLDTDVKFVHYIKLAQKMAGLGNEHMRAPRLPLSGEERTRIEAVITEALSARPALPVL